MGFGCGYEPVSEAVSPSTLKLPASHTDFTEEANTPKKRRRVDEGAADSSSCRHGTQAEEDEEEGNDEGGTGEHWLATPLRVL